jgi:hypothetical protein
MPLTDFFRDRKIAKLSRQFATLIEQNETLEALRLYEASLAPLAPYVASAVRALYHLHRWIEHREDPDVRAIEALAEGQPEDSPLSQSANILRRLRREANLAQALRQRAPAQLTGPAAPTRSRRSRDLERLALAALETYRLIQGVPPRQVAIIVKRTLDASAQFDAPEREVREKLQIWSAWTLQEYARLFEELEPAMQSEPKRFRLAALYAWGNSELIAGRLDAALRALVQLQAHVQGNNLLRVALLWGFGAVRAGRLDTAIKWFSHLTLRKIAAGSPAGEQLLEQATSLAYFQAGRFSAGRGRLDAALAQNSQVDIRAQALFLLGLSWLAEAQDWDSTREDGDEQANQDLRLHNRALWGELRDRMTSVIEALQKLPQEQAWPAALLRGLVAYVDSSIVISLDQLLQFGRAIERIDDPAGRKRLTAIEGALLTRARATEEAIGYIRRQEFAKLRALQDQVLAPLGDAVPPLVRAAVYLTLWLGDPVYDPLPDLQRIPLAPEHEAAVHSSIEQVKATQTIYRLRILVGRAQLDSNEAPPALTPLTIDPEMEQLGALATAALHLRRDEWRAALAALPHLDEGARPDLQDMAEYIRLYASWKSGEALQLSARVSNRYLARYPRWQVAIGVRQLVHALDAGDQKQITAKLAALDSMIDPKDHPGRLIRLASWLIRRPNPQAALRLLNTGPKNAVSSLLSAVAAAQLGQHTACGAACDQILANPKAGDFVKDHARLVRLQVELASLAQSSGDVRQRWPSVRRVLLEQAANLHITPELQAYGFLIQGLVSYISTDTLIDEETMSRLMQAQQALVLSRHAAFLQQVIAQLKWRSKVIKDFWGGLQQGDLKLSRMIYGKELAPAFGERVPASIQLGMVIVDWDAGQASSRDLLARLAHLEHDAPELSRDILEKTRKYIEEGDQIRRFTRLIQESDFDGVIDFVQRTEWSHKGIPIAVAIALLYAYYKTERIEDAKRLSEILADDPHMPDWVRNYGFIIKGYVYFREADYEKAAEAFEKLPVKDLLGHNTDRYWAISHFSHGLQLLRVAQNERAFSAFRRSIGQRGQSRDNANLAPLFVYFGLKNILARNGNQALQAFSLMQDSLAGLPPENGVLKYQLVAQLGSLLCHSLLAQNMDTLIGGTEYLALLTQLDSGLEAAERHQFEATLRRMAIAQELRRQRALDPRQRSKKGQLRGFLEQEISSLENLERDAENHDEAADDLRKHDPVLLVLHALIALRLVDRPNVDSAMEYLTQATRLGVRAARIAELITTLQQERAQAAEKKRALIELFDAYLLQGTIPPSLRDQFGRRDDLAELYRLSRNYTPRDLSVLHVQSTVDIMIRRTGHLVCTWAEQQQLGDTALGKDIELLKERLKSDGQPDDQLASSISQIGQHLKNKDSLGRVLGELCEQIVRIRDLENTILHKEAQIMNLFAQEFMAA